MGSLLYSLKQQYRLYLTQGDPKVLYHPYNPLGFAPFQNGSLKVIGVPKGRFVDAGALVKFQVSVSIFVQKLQERCRILDHPV